MNQRVKNRLSQIQVQSVPVLEFPSGFLVFPSFLVASHDSSFIPHSVMQKSLVPMMLMAIVNLSKSSGKGIKIQCIIMIMRSPATTMILKKD